MLFQVLQAAVVQSQLYIVVHVLVCIGTAQYVLEIGTTIPVIKCQIYFSASKRRVKLLNKRTQTVQ